MSTSSSQVTRSPVFNGAAQGEPAGEVGALPALLVLADEDPVRERAGFDLCEEEVDAFVAEILSWAVHGLLLVWGKGERGSTTACDCRGAGCVLIAGGGVQEYFRSTRHPLVQCRFRGYLPGAAVFVFVAVIHGNMLRKLLQNGVWGRGLRLEIRRLQGRNRAVYPARFPLRQRIAYQQAMRRPTHSPRVAASASKGRAGPPTGQDGPIRAVSSPISSSRLPASLT